VSTLLDTNIVSELRKGTRCNARVAGWWAAIDRGTVFMSVLVLGEIRRGIELVRPRDPVYANELEAWLGWIEKEFANRILPIDAAIADVWGRINSKRTTKLVDGLLAATAKAHGLTLVTRNGIDVQDLGITLHNPFT
jgi:predicted nucleic acid-binding protein